MNYKRLTQRDKHYREVAATAFKDHVLTVEWQGPENHCAWRCRKPGDSAYAFQVVTMPGWVMVRGDIGEMMWERAENMLAWVRGAIDSTEYFLEKVPHSFKKTEYDEDVAADWVAEEIKEAARDRGTPIEERRSRIESLREAALLISDGEYAFLGECYGRELFDGCDAPNLRLPTNTFFWTREALRWLLERI